MGFSFKKRLDESTEERIQAFFATLSEKDRRRFAALESQRFGHGGIAYIARLLDCSRRTVERGIAELTQLPEDLAAGRTRQKGGGRKKKIETVPGLEDNLVEALQ